MINNVYPYRYTYGKISASGIHGLTALTGLYLGFLIFAAMATVLTNLVLLSAILRDKSMYQSRGYFMFSLALSDFLYGAFILPHATSKTYLQLTGEITI